MLLSSLSLISSLLLVCGVYWLVDDGEYPGWLGEYPALGLHVERRNVRTILVPINSIRSLKDLFQELELHYQLTCIVENLGCNPGSLQNCMDWRGKKIENIIQDSFNTQNEEVYVNPLPNHDT